MFLNSYIVYASWIADIYFVLKLINPTQGMTINYQLIELKLITFQEFKFLIAIKLYGCLPLFHRDASVCIRGGSTATEYETAHAYRLGAFQLVREWLDAFPLQLHN